MFQAFKRFSEIRIFEQDGTSWRTWRRRRRHLPSLPEDGRNEVRYIYTADFVAQFCRAFLHCIIAHWSLKPGNANRGGRLSAVDLLIKIDCFVKKVGDIFNLKRSWSKLIITRRPTVLSLPLHLGFPAKLYRTLILHLEVFS